jgi:hypothetical protein
MHDLIIHNSIEDAQRDDFVPIYADDDEFSVIPCLDFFVESGVLELVHVPMVEHYVIFPEHVRFDVRGLFDPDILRRDLAVGGVLGKLLVELRRAALIDHGLLAACEACSTRLESLIENVETANNIGNH